MARMGQGSYIRVLLCALPGVNARLINSLTLSVVVFQNDMIAILINLSDELSIVELIECFSIICLTVRCMCCTYILAEHCWLILASLSYKPSVVKRDDVETDWSAS